MKFIFILKSYFSNTVNLRRGHINILYNRIIMFLYYCSFNDLSFLIIFSRRWPIYGGLLFDTFSTKQRVNRSYISTSNRLFSILNTNTMQNINSKSNRSNILTNILKSLLIKCDNNKYLANNDTQIEIEKLVFEQYKLLFEDSKASISGVNLDLLTPKLKKFIFSKQEILISKLDDYIFYLNNGKLKKDEDIFKEVINSLPKNSILNICIYYFLQICTFQSTDDIDKFKLSRVSINMGDACIKLYLLEKKTQYEYEMFKDENEKGEGSVDHKNTDKVILKKTKYTVWYSHFTKSQPELSHSLNDDDKIKFKLGAVLVKLLLESEFIEQDLKYKARDESVYVLKVDDNLIQPRVNSTLNLPLKLPMIVEPKKYSENIVGGYLLNNIDYQDELIIHKGTIKDKSEIKEENVIYNMINKVSSVPYKINKELLDFLIFDKHKLLIDCNEIIEMEKNIENMTKTQKSQLTSLKSKFHLQETILGIADFYKDFSKIYFPLRLDTRGRVYCDNNYLHYKSTELAKSLLLFANPSVISKKSLDDT
uniref:DNA-directed RNA polymerase N-terminal domain-containing protein n=1 Tax=Epichloe typhina TaxID=5113 RepID=A0A1J0D017_EPITY|nr:hypothetical protein [Epichloe typhina]APB96740.1 hypothetical protein [Epichloe typhina]